MKSTDHWTDTQYSYGCRCSACREAHAEVSRKWKWERTYGKNGPMGPEVRSKILGSLRRTRNVVETAREVGVSHQAIYRAVSAVPGFGDLVAELTRPREQSAAQNSTND